MYILTLRQKVQEIWRRWVKFTLQPGCAEVLKNLTVCAFWLIWFCALGRGRMYDNNCFHKQVCIMAEQGEGKIKATFCNLSRARDSLSVEAGDLFFFWQCGKLICSADSTTAVCSHNLAVASLCLLGCRWLASSPGVNSGQRYVTTVVGVAGASPICLCGKQKAVRTRRGSCC